MSTVSSATSLTSTYYMRNFYANNSGVIKSSARSDYSKTELSYEDSLALHRAIKKLENYKYTDEENEDNINHTIAAFVNTYNYAVDSSDSSSSSTMERYSKQLKKLASKYSDELDDIGITVNKDGTLDANTNLIKASELDDLKSLFGKDSKFASSLKNISKHMSSAAGNLVSSTINYTV